MPKFLLIIFLTLTLYANDRLSLADDYFAQKEYGRALQLYVEIAHEKKDPKIAYKIAWMYDNAHGTVKNQAESQQWYKRAAEWSATDEDLAKSVEKLYRSYDPVSSTTTSETMLQYMSGAFFLRAFHPNYVVVSFLDTVPQGDLSQVNQNFIKAETKFQLSLRGDYLSNWFGGDQIWTVAYTQRSYWQLFISSEPFRETNYMPEAFVTVPFFHLLDAAGIKGAALGFIHQSNGQKEYYDPTSSNTVNLSRSWNRLYIKTHYQWGSFFGYLNLWYPISSTGTLHDNADIVDYYGLGELEVNYAYGKLLSRFNGRYNIRKNRGAAQVELTYPVGSSKRVFYYLQGFTGYGQSLIDYHNYINQVGFGISVSR